MVKQYIGEQKKLTEQKISEKQDELKAVQDKENFIYEKIHRINQSDIDFEIFSPRTGEVSLREKIKSMEKELQQAQNEEAELKKEIEQLSKQKSDFEFMLKELRRLK